MIVVGTAGWSIPRAEAAAFPPGGHQLARYAQVFSGAEINSSFHRPHAAAVYAKWAAMTPPYFRFAVKVPRTITHEGRLRRSAALLDQFLAQVAGLGGKLGPLLVQLPPSFAFDARVARTFFRLLRERHPGAVVCEPRHASWFGAAADRLLVAWQVGRVAADPCRVPGADIPGGWLTAPASASRPPTVYYRLHGSPRPYWSRYPAERIAAWAVALTSLSEPVDAWCMFDNTASGAAAGNALELAAHVGHRQLPP